MPKDITDSELQNLLDQKLSQTEISRRTGIARSTLRRRLNTLCTPNVHQTTQPQDEFITMMDDFREVLEWWQQRKQALQPQDDAGQETERKTYHVQKRYIAAIQRAADLERVSIAEIVNRAFKEFFDRHN